MHAEGAAQAMAGMSAPEAPAAEAAGDLVRRLQRGERAAFETVLDRHERLVLGLALRLLGNRDDARDAAQEVFLRLHRYASSIDPEQPLRPWLCRVTVNVCRDALRTKAAAGQVFAPGDQRERAESMPGASAAEVEAPLLLDERRRVLRQALVELPERERLALVLRDVQGLSTSEVAAMLGTSDVTVRSQISRGRLRLRGLVERLLGERRG